MGCNCHYMATCQGIVIPLVWVFTCSRWHSCTEGFLFCLEGRCSVDEWKLSVASQHVSGDLTCDGRGAGCPLCQVEVSDLYPSWPIPAGPSRLRLRPGQICCHCSGEDNILCVPCNFYYARHSDIRQRGMRRRIVENSRSGSMVSF